MCVHFPDARSKGGPRRANASDPLLNRAPMGLLRMMAHNIFFVAHHITSPHELLKP